MQADSIERTVQKRRYEKTADLGCATRTAPTIPIRPAATTASEKPQGRRVAIAWVERDGGHDDTDAGAGSSGARQARIARRGRQALKGNETSREAPDRLSRGRAGKPSRGGVMIRSGRRRRVGPQCLRNRDRSDRWRNQAVADPDAEAQPKKPGTPPRADHHEPVGPRQPVTNVRLRARARPSRYGR